MNRGGILRWERVLELRNLTRDDLTAVARRLAAEFARGGFSAENIAFQVFDDPDYDPDLNLLAADGDRLVAVLLGVRRGESGFVKALTVHPDGDAAGRLLAEFEQRVRRAGAVKVRYSGSAPFYFQPGVEPTDTRTVTWLFDHGFQKIGDAFNMVADLAAQDFDTRDEEALASAAGYRITRLSAGDEEAFGRFVERCFSTGWRWETWTTLRWSPPTAHLAWQADEVVAFAAAEATNPGWFGPMGTDPEHREHGLGRLLLRRCLQDLKALGYREAQIGWVGPLGFYARHCEARVSRVFWLLEKLLEREG